MSERGDVKNIGDAGDSTREGDGLEIPETLLTSPVCEMVRGIRRALQCGDHQGLKLMMGKLEIWRRSGKSDVLHDYWRVAQYLGETEMNTINILLSVTCDKPDNIKWNYLADALSVLSLTLCNREIIFKLLAYTQNILPILVQALEQESNEDVLLEALNVIQVAVIVTRARFANGLLTCRFLDPLVARFLEKGPPGSVSLLEVVLQVIKSLLMCGQPHIHTYAVDVLKKLDRVMTRVSHVHGQQPDTEAKQRQLVLDLYGQLKRSVEGDAKPHVCAKYWTRGQLRKDLLSKCLKQQWLYIYCSWPACGHHNALPNTFFRKCGACLVVRYCSRQCQQKHWQAGHSIQCKVISNQGKSD